MTKQIPKTWDPDGREQELYANWENAGYFKPEYRICHSRGGGNLVDRKIPDQVGDDKACASFSYDREKDGAPFVISMPPPNVTGALHMGHALFVTVEDIMARYHRLLGQPTLWLPGVDHAGIATQTRVDKELRKQGINKNEIGREKFLEKVWEWKEQYGSTITEQMRRLGASCDWSRERFTLDDGLSLAVRTAFVDLYNKGLIYRGEYIVNWCPKCHTAIADDEVDHTEQNAKLYYFKYDKNFPITIATTRPETKLGDTGVAVNPNDKRYAGYVGKTFEVDLDGVKRSIEVFADRAVDAAFGTGAVGVTPAHSVIDWKMGEEHKLPIIKVINENGRMTEAAGEKYAELKVLEAREKLIQYLRDSELLEKEVEILNNLSVCYRCNGAIEPLPSLQWFVKMRPLADKASKVVKDGEVKIIPERFEKVYFNWMDNIRDWCVSRQLWWGHQIPVWYREKPQDGKAGTQKNWQLKIYGQNIFEAIASGNKSIETRAGKPAGAEKQWGDFKPGDTVTFTLADQKTDQPSEPVQQTTKAVRSTACFDSIDDMLKAHDIKTIFPSGDEQSYRDWWQTKPELSDRIEQFGIWAIGLGTNNATIEQSSNSEVYCGLESPSGEGWIQDPDVLDTWFSSALWPFSTLGWPHYASRKARALRGMPEKCEHPLTYAPGMTTCDYNYFYPTTVMETGYDILFFWVARMVMFGLEFTGKAPFNTVYLHGLVRDEKNRKMSKSLGNVLNPLDLIPKYGTDAVRMAVIVGSTPGQDLPIGEGKIKGYRNFSNKIWNASRYVILQVSEGNLQTGEIGDNRAESLELREDLFTEADRSILGAHEETKEAVTRLLNEYKFSLAGEKLYEYFWHFFADVYIEESKKQFLPVIPTSVEGSFVAGGQQDLSTALHSARDDNREALAENTKKILIKVLTETLVMLHPFMPFVTEAVWQDLREIYPALSESIMITEWPK